MVRHQEAKHRHCHSIRLLSYTFGLCSEDCVERELDDLPPHSYNARLGKVRDDQQNDIMLLQ